MMWCDVKTPFVKDVGGGNGRFDVDRFVWCLMFVKVFDVKYGISVVNY